MVNKRERERGICSNTRGGTESISGPTLTPEIPKVSCERGKMFVMSLPQFSIIRVVDYRLFRRFSFKRNLQEKRQRQASEALSHYQLQISWMPITWHLIRNYTSPF